MASFIFTASSLLRHFNHQSIFLFLKFNSLCRLTVCNLIVIVLLIIFSNPVAAQQYLRTLEKQSSNYFEQQMTVPVPYYQYVFHSAFKPYLAGRNKSEADTGIQIIEVQKSKRFFPWLNTHLLKSDFISIVKDELTLKINPLVDFEYGKDFSHNRTTYCNSRGIRATGTLGKKLSFETDFSENQMVFPSYVVDYIHTVTAFAPGAGKIKVYKPTTAFDFTTESGLIAYNGGKHFNVIFGQGKNFIGDGYRSLLLSDNSSAYPYLRVTTSAWKFQYTNLWAEMFDAKEKSKIGEGFRKKYLALHYLSTCIGKKMELGLFEAVVWQAQDSSSYRGFDVQYLNPLIFYHAIQWNSGSPDNSMLGLNFRWKIYRGLVFYNQLFLDDWNFSKMKKEKGFSGNKYAYQLGLKCFDAFGIKGFYLQAEYNEIYPYTYGHKLTTINYAHANQSLTTPIGSNSREVLGFIQYHHKRWFAGAELMYVMEGIDSDTGNVGHDIFNSDYNILNSTKQGTYIGTFGNYVGQGIPQSILFAQLKLNYLINPANNLRAEVSFTHREQNTDGIISTTNFITFGIKTSLFNHYYDF